MSEQSISAVTGSNSLSSNTMTSQSDLPRQPEIKALPEIEFKEVSAVDADVLQQAVDAANALFSQVRPDIKFVIDESTKDVVIMLIEPETGDVINRYPTEQALAISNAIVESQARAAGQQEAFRQANDQLIGLFVQQKI